MNRNAQAAMAHADYVGQIDRLRAALQIVAELDVHRLRPHHDKLRALGPLDPVAWAKHGKRIQEELYLIYLAETVAAAASAAGLTSPDLPSTAAPQ